MNAGVEMRTKEKIWLRAETPMALYLTIQKKVPNVGEYRQNATRQYYP